VLVSGVILGLLNYYLFIRDKKFLERGFKKDKKGGVLIVVLIISIIFTFISVANMNRAKIIKKIEESGVNNKQLNKKNSLERRIRDWFDETF
jgi:predicted PurR-regulated permease PerM